MWRMSDDFWDEWPLIEAQLALRGEVSAYRPLARSRHAAARAPGPAQRDTLFTANSRIPPIRSAL